MELTLGDGTKVTVRIFSDFVLFRLSDQTLASLTSIGRAIFERDFDFVDEVIATEVEICLATNGQFDSAKLEEIERVAIAGVNSATPKNHVLPIFIDEQHEDWQYVETHTGLKRNEYAERLLSSELSIAMIGFLPGFVYINGLPPELHVPRKSTPSTRTLPNSFAIGGKYAGIYSLQSAAGWNCIGRIGAPIFDDSKLPPVSLGPGDSITLERIDEGAFNEMPQAKREDGACKRFSVFDETRGTLVFENTGLFSLIQDEGRKGLAWYAIPRGGAMDATSAELANTIVGNSVNAPVIECHLISPRIRFASDATICLTGANMKWQIDGQRVGRNRTVNVPAGSVLDGTAAMTGWRAYIAIQGEIDTSRSFGSASTYAPAKFGGNWGKPFAVGDSLQWIKPEKKSFPVHLSIENGSQSADFEIERGPEFDWMDERSVDVFFNSEFCVTSQSDRMGARLDGPTLGSSQKRMADSVPLLPGMVQLTPEGQCIVVLQDGQTTGGYPRIGYLNQKAIERLNQTKIGQPFRFRLAD